MLENYWGCSDADSWIEERHALGSNAILVVCLCLLVGVMAAAFTAAIVAAVNA